MTKALGLACALLTLSLAACSTVPTALPPSPGHIQDEGMPASRGAIPAPVQAAPVLPRPRRAAKTETYSVVVNNVRVQELLFALARDAKLNVDIHPGISGTVTLNAIDQTLPQLLDRIAKQSDMRYELDGPNLVVMPDSPFLRTYRVDYVNMSRDVTGTVTINTQIASTGGTAATGSNTSATTGAGGGNSSTTEVKNTGRNRFWESLEKNIKDLLHETDKILPEGSSETVIERADLQATTGTGTAAAPPRAARGGAEPSIAGSPNPASFQSGGTTVVRRTTFREAASVIVNPESGVVTVRATSRQHEKVQEFLDSVMASARRQVLIEATIAEVTLSDTYKQGIDWQYLRNQGSQVAVGQGATTQRIDPLTGSSQSVVSTLPSAVANTLFTAAFRNGGVTAAIRLLQSFGNVKVLSSPKLSVLNNQTALLKVVDNIVFFNVKADTTQNVNNTLTTVTTTPQSVSVGLVMSVTPQISEADTVLLNVRPTISRVTGFVSDPNPSIPAGLTNQVPQIQTREMESVMRVANGDIAVLGGLMQDQINYLTDAVPGVSKIPLLGTLFSHRNDTSTKTELVIFLRPVVIHDASIAGDFSGYREQLPDQDYFGNNPGPPQPNLDFRGER